VSPVRLLRPFLLVLLCAAASAEEDEKDEVPIEAPTLDDRLMEFRGGVEAGFRFVGGEEGRYDQDLRLGSGLRLLSADLAGTTRGEGDGIDTLDLHARGIGDPDRRVDFRVRERESYDLSLHADRLEYAFAAAGELHPFETVRRSEGGSLRVHPRPGLEAFLSIERRQREGDARLHQVYRDDRSLPLPATLDYHGRTWTAGFDAAPGALRFGGTASWNRASESTLRLLDRPDTPVPDEGPFRNGSDMASRTFSGRAGLRLFRGRLDLSASGGYTTARTESRVRERVVSTAPGSNGIPGDSDDLAYSSETRGRTGNDLRGRWWRGEALVLPSGDWEVLARYERRLTDERGRADLRLRDQSPPFSDPSAPFFHLVEEPGALARLSRLGVEARWRASRQWRLRGGVERVDERVVTVEDELESWSPETRIATAGADWTPSERFDASLLVRAADQRDDATQLSPGEADGVTLRLRGRDPGGSYATGYARLKDRQVERSDSQARVNAVGAVLGHAGTDGFAEFTVERRTYLLESDTRFTADRSVNGVKSPRRVRYDEETDTLGLDLSRTVSGPVRAFGRGWWNRSAGDYPWRRYDAALGLGWRFHPSTELRLEVRRVVLNEGGLLRDDYRADILTVSVLWEF